MIKGNRSTVLTETRVQRSMQACQIQQFECIHVVLRTDHLAATGNIHNQTCLPTHSQYTHNRQVPAISHTSCMYKLLIGSCCITKISSKYATPTHTTQAYTGISCHTVELMTCPNCIFPMKSLPVHYRTKTELLQDYKPDPFGGCTKLTMGDGRLVCALLRAMTPWC